MKTCEKCGASLAEGAQYCMQCGTAVEAAVQPSSSLPTGIFVAPALLSGSVMGVLASIPFVNCLCCAWILGGGGFAAWLVGKKLPRGAGTLTYGDGAFAGVLTGVWGAIVTTAVSLPLRFLSAEALADMQGQFQDALSQSPDIPDTVREIIMSMLSPEVTALSVLVGLVVNLMLYGLFAMIGGILLVAVLRRNQNS